MIEKLRYLSQLETSENEMFLFVSDNTQGT
jgi:hypothetical protein